ncbi:DUF6461 domain-containing protein [Streptomyces sp. NBC_01754]|uniref:DUF6461 domain-containing protein n=1 Tax=Streptomyces sp. NBC_01754 TaxID=2975930 RepID=UPI002DDA6D95|nr:DUF6461 domain-containing protein [Streptomyces sp. NBC_01754]WSC91712.1 DUF6461 domain-containing protein [Streptomyces sp. NBC_01754]
MSPGHSTAATYAWLRERYPRLIEAYCVTLVQGLSPEALLKALGAEPAERMTGVAELSGPAYEEWGPAYFVGVTAVGDWSLMVEYNGFVGTRKATAPAVSRGRTVVSHFRNVNAVDHFHWCEDGVTRLHFEPLFPYCRDGSDPDGLITEMRESGFDLSDADDRFYGGHTEAAFALAEHVTGVRLTPDLFASAEFVCGRVPNRR